jgi:hypothetical protein
MNILGYFSLLGDKVTLGSLTKNTKSSPILGHSLPRQKLCNIIDKNGFTLADFKALVTTNI